MAQERIRTEVGSIEETRATLRQIDRLLKNLAANSVVLARASGIDIALAIESISYTPAVSDDWEDPDPDALNGALDRIAGGHAGVVFIGPTAPVDPGNGQLWLDTSTTGTGGLGILAVVTIAADLTLTSSHLAVFCDASAGPIVVTVPAASSNGGRLYAIIKTDPTANAVTMDGGFDAVLSCQDEAVPILSDSTNWRIPF